MRLRIWRIGLAVATLAAVVTQLVRSLGNPAFDVVHFCSYFTILSNVFAALVLARAAAATPPSHALDVLRGAATLCMAMVGITFTLLLTNVESDLIAWVNVVVHYVMPVALVVDWSIDAPRTKIEFRDALVWLAIPLAYVVYTQLRGSLVHWYPYPFLDVDEAGYGVVARYIASLLVLTSILAALIALLGNSRRARYSS